MNSAGEQTPSSSAIADVLERYRRGVEVVAVATTGAAGPQLDYQPTADSWSVRQVLCHLADAELLAAVRFRRIVAEDNPPLFSYPQTVWAERLHYEKRRISDTLDMFRRLRAQNHKLLQSLPVETFERVGTHDVDGTLTLLALVRSYIDHTEKHAGQIHETRRLYKAARTGS